MHYKPQIQKVYSIQRERHTHRKKRKTVGDLNIETPVITRPTKQHRHRPPLTAFTPATFKLLYIVFLFFCLDLNAKM